MEDKVKKLLYEQLEELCEENKTITKFASKNETHESIVKVHETINKSIIGIADSLLR